MLTDNSSALEVLIDVDLGDNRRAGVHKIKVPD